MLGAVMSAIAPDSDTVTVVLLHDAGISVHTKPTELQSELFRNVIFDVPFDSALNVSVIMLPLPLTPVETPPTACREYPTISTPLFAEVRRVVVPPPCSRKVPFCAETKLITAGSYWM